LVGTGVVRTVVKLPLDWALHPVEAVHLAVEPPSAASRVVVHALRIQRFDGATVSPVTAPPPVIVPEKLSARSAD
jgi:hypothetical protein